MFCEKCGLKFDEEDHFCQNCGSKVLKDYLDYKTKKSFLYKLKLITSNFTIKTKRKRIIFLLITIVILVIVLILLRNKIFNSSAEIPNNSQAGLSERQIKDKELQKSFDNNLKESVVNIVCSNKDDKYFNSAKTGGSGTMLSASGMIITNFHILPSEKQKDLDNTICLVTLPEPTLGTPAEAYVAVPRVFPDLSSKYDLAFLDITSSYTDEKGDTYGDYNKDHAIYDNTACIGKGDPVLGERIKIFGYPSVNGGKFLTITDGLISSFEDNGDIVTSAKIDKGNSGGLAVDENGCIVGVPSAVTLGTYENLGIIISVNNVNKFLQEFREKNDLEQTFKSISFQ